MVRLFFCCIHSVVAHFDITMHLAMQLTQGRDYLIKTITAKLMHEQEGRRQNIELRAVSLRLLVVSRCTAFVSGRFACSHNADSTSKLAAIADHNSRLGDGFRHARANAPSNTAEGGGMSKMLRFVHWAHMGVFVSYSILLQAHPLRCSRRWARTMAEIDRAAASGAAEPASKSGTGN